MKRKKGKSRQWTRRKKRKTAKVEEDDAGEMKKKEMDGTKTTTEAGSSSSVAELPLPLDVWGDIFSRLPFKQVLLCRCICRAWNALLSRIHHHPNPNPTTPAALLYYPWMCGRDSGMPLGNYLTLVELCNGASYESTVMRLKDRYIYLSGVGSTATATATAEDEYLWPVASCHGLVCFVRRIDWERGKIFFLGNPLLKEHLLEVRPSQIKMKTTGSLSHSSKVVGFGFIPGADRYKIVTFTWFWSVYEEDQSHFLICTVGKGKRKVCLPSWRRLLSFPLHFRLHSCPLGSHLKAGIHWLVSDSHKDNSVFISRLDLDTEQFGRVEAPQSPDFNRTPLGNLSLSASDGHLIICANSNFHGHDIIDIWVMNQFNLWTKNLVVRSPITPDCTAPVEVLNYGKVEAAAREGAVAEVMLLVGSSRLFACTTQGRHMRQLDSPPCSEDALVHIPSLLSIKDVAKL